MRKNLFLAVACFLILSFAVYPEVSFGQQPRIPNKSFKDCCGDQDCLKMDVQILGWDHDSRKFIVGIGKKVVLMNKRQVGYTLEESRYCFRRWNKECFEEDGRTPKASAECALCALEHRSLVKVPGAREVLVARSKDPEKSFLLPNVPFQKCFSCHPESKKALRARTEGEFGRSLPEIFDNK